MKKWKQLAAASMAGLMAVSALTACGSKQEPAPASSAASAETKAADASAETEAKPESTGDPVTLRFAWWGNDARHEKTLKVIEMYQEQHPNVTIEPEYRGKSEREKVATELGSGTSADIVQLNPPWMGDFVANGDFFVDLGQYDFDIDGFDQHMISDYCTYNGTLITLPSGLNARTYLMNKTKLDEMGIACDMDTTWTWDDLITIGKTVHEKDAEKYFLNADKVDLVEFVIRPYIIQKTGKFLIGDDYELGFTKEDLTEALEYVTFLYTENVVVPAADGNTFLNAVWTNPAWINGNLTSELSWTSLMEGAIADSQDEYVTTTLPMHSDAKDTSIVVKPSQLYAIVKTSEHPDEAADFLKFLLTDEEAGKVLGDCRGVPPYKAVQDMCMAEGILDDQVIIATQYAQEHAGMYENTASTNAEITAVLQDAVETVSYDASKVGEAADQAMVLIEDILSTLK